MKRQQPKIPKVKKQKTELEKLRDKAWKLMSIYTRRRYADWKGQVQCFTCYVIDDWRYLQAGHFRHRFLDFDEQNIHPQCYLCNRYAHGNTKVYERQLISKYGSEVIAQIDARVNIERRRIDKLGYAYTKKELEQIIKDLTDKISKLQ